MTTAKRMAQKKVATAAAPQTTFLKTLPPSPFLFFRRVNSVVAPLSLVSLPHTVRGEDFFPLHAFLVVRLENVVKHLSPKCKAQRSLPMLCAFPLLTQTFCVHGDKLRISFFA